MVNLARIAWSLDLRQVTPRYAATHFSVGGLTVPYVRLWVFATTVVLSVLFLLLLERTRLGRAIRATAEELRAARLTGIPVAWSPEHLLLAAVETCFLFTLRAVARASQVEFTTCDVTAEGTVDRADGALRFTDIVLRARLVAPSADPARALRAMEKAKQACLVSASLAVPVRLEPEVV